MMKFIILLFTVTVTGCYNNHTGMIVRDAQGNLYRLEDYSSITKNDVYHLQKIDSTEVIQFYQQAEKLK